MFQRHDYLADISAPLYERLDERRDRVIEAEMNSLSHCTY